MPEPAPAPVTAEDLRERIAKALAPWCRVHEITEAPCERCALRVDAVVAALAGDPGDLRERLVRAMHAVVVCDPTEAVTIGALAAAALSVRWEDHAATLARLAQAEARVAELEAEQVAASEEVFQLMAHTDETCSVVADRDRALAEVERLRAELETAHEERDAARLVSKGRTMEQYDAIERAEKAEAEGDALKAAIAEAVKQIRKWMDPEDPGPLFAPGFADEVDRTLKTYIGEHVIAALAVPESTESAPTETPEWTETDEMWHMALWLRQDAAPDVCDRIRQVPGVVELYRAYPSPCITPETTPDAPTGGED